MEIRELRRNNPFDGPPEIMIIIGSYYSKLSDSTIDTVKHLSQVVSINSFFQFSLSCPECIAKMAFRAFFRRPPAVPDFYGAPPINIYAEASNLL